MSPNDVDIIISDFGSAPEHRHNVLALAATHGARVHYTEADGL